MANRPKKKFFYHIDEVCDRLGLSLLDMSVLVSEQKIQLCTAVARLYVEDGFYEANLDGKVLPNPEEQLYVQGLVDLKADDAWFILRHGSQMIFWLDAGQDRYRRLISMGEDDRGYTVIREEVGVRHEELERYTAMEAALDDAETGTKAGGRGSQPTHAWDAARLEACRFIYFEGVPESYGALIRHVQAWFAQRGGKVPDESTLKRRLRDIWVTFGPEAKQRGKD
jgi:hypothetical protein